MYYEYAVKKFLKKTKEDLTLEEFAARMEMISPESRRFIIKRWGLKSDYYDPCGPEMMNYLWKISNAETIVEASVKEFCYMKYVSYVKDRDELGIVLSHNIGYLVERLHKVNPEFVSKPGPDTVCGLELLNEIEGLWLPQTRNVLLHAFGLTEYSSKILTRKELADEFNLSTSRIGAILGKAYRQISYPTRRDAYFTPVINKDDVKKEAHVEIPINLSILISNSLFIEQLEIIKESAAIDRIDQLVEMDAESLAELTKLDYEICAFWILMANRFKNQYIYTRLESSIDDLYLNKRVKKALKRSGIHTIKEFLELTLFRARNMPNIGESSIEEIKMTRERMGFPIK